MELTLSRIYFPEATNGQLYVNGRMLCYSIELPWVDNIRRISCIPEGRYQVRKRYSKKFGWHIHLIDVPERDFILIHPANDARKELRGCIAPVTAILKPGHGTQSRKANEALKFIVYDALKRGEEVFLIIEKAKEDEEHEYHRAV